MEKALLDSKESIKRRIDEIMDHSMLLSQWDISTIDSISNEIRDGDCCDKEDFDDYHSFLDDVMSNLEFSLEEKRAEELTLSNRKNYCYV